MSHAKSKVFNVGYR